MKLGAPLYTVKLFQYTFKRTNLRQLIVSPMWWHNLLFIFCYSKPSINWTLDIQTHSVNWISLSKLTAFEFPQPSQKPIGHTGDTAYPSEKPSIGADPGLDSKSTYIDVSLRQYFYLIYLIIYITGHWFCSVISNLILLPWLICSDTLDSLLHG